MALLMSIHNICFYGEIREIFFRYHLPPYLQLCVDMSGDDGVLCEQIGLCDAVFSELCLLVLNFCPGHIF